MAIKKVKEGKKLRRSIRNLLGPVTFDSHILYVNNVTASALIAIFKINFAMEMNQFLESFFNDQVAVPFSVKTCHYQCTLINNE